MKTSCLIFNETRTGVFQRLKKATHSDKATTRVETLEGRSHVVVPMVILTEGVHNGSGGALYYPPGELGKTPESWNHKPIVVYHPELNGQGISACSPNVLNNRKIGVMLNTQWDVDKKRLKSEAWIEKPRADLIDERVMAAINNHKMLEVSTGVYVDVCEEEGLWNEEGYNGIAKNYRPDHLALLPDKVGACSISDGAGFLRNEVDMKKMFRRFMENEMSYSNIQQSLQTKLLEKLKIPDGERWSVWICDVYGDFFVYEYDGKLFRLGYSSSNTEVTLSGDDPTEVKRVTEYRTADGAFVGNRTEKQQINNTMNKKEVVDSIIANSASGWTEAERPKLMEFSEKQLQAITNGMKAGVPNPPAPPGTPPAQPAMPGTPVTQPGTPAPATNATPAPAPGTPAPIAQTPARPVSMEDYIQQAPEPFRDVLHNSLQLHAEEKGRLVTVITGNANNGFTPEELNAKSIRELRNLARLAQKEPTIMANYGGQGLQPPATNAGEEPLALPVINYEPVGQKKAAAK